MSLDTRALATFVKKNPLLIACIVLGLGLLATLYMRSGLREEQQAELAQKSTEGKRYHENLINAIRLDDELKAVTEANRVARERAIKPANLAENLQYFYRLEAETGVTYTDLRQQGVAAAKAPDPKKKSKEPPPAYVPVTYSISVEGDFPKIIAFLRSLEHGVHFYRLNSLIASGTGPKVTLHLNVDLLGQP